MGSGDLGIAAARDALPGQTRGSVCWSSQRSTSLRRYRKTLPTRPGVEVSWCRTIRTGSKGPVADMAANAYTKELLMSMSTNDRQLLESIDSALERIEEGQYGKCVHCGQPIQEKRLEAVPWARHCLRCQDLNERGLLTPDEE